MAQDKIRVIFTVTIATLYLGSFLLPAWHHSYAYSFLGAMFGGQPISGARTFVVALFSIIGIPMWLANPFAWVGLFSLALGKEHIARLAAFVAVLLALSGLPFIFSGVLVGYYVWLISIFLLLVASFYCFRMLKPPQPCALCLLVLEISALILGLMVVWLLFNWKSSFFGEDLHWY